MDDHIQMHISPESLPVLLCLVTSLWCESEGVYSSMDSSRSSTCRLPSGTDWSDEVYRRKRLYIRSAPGKHRFVARINNIKLSHWTVGQDFLSGVSDCWVFFFFRLQAFHHHPRWPHLCIDNRVVHTNCALFTTEATVNCTLSGQNPLYSHSFFMILTIWSLLTACCSRLLGCFFWFSLLEKWALDTTG